jgi:hypothetical protein
MSSKPLLCLRARSRAGLPETRRRMCISAGASSKSNRLTSTTTRSWEVAEATNYSTRPTLKHCQGGQSLASPSDTQDAQG